MGFWDFLFSRSSDNNKAGNKTDFSRGPDSREAGNAPGLLEEYAAELYADNDANTDNSYSENGVSLKEAANVFRLTYDGVLAKDGTRDVYAVVGLEGSDPRQDAKYYPMQKTDDGKAYEVLFPSMGPGNIKVAFKDGAGHWDDNSGRNYTYVNGGG